MWDSIVFVNRGVTIHHPKLYISFSPAWISACIPNHWRAPVSFMNSDPSMRGYALSRWRTLRSSPRLAPYNSQSQSMYGERYVLISLHKGRCVQRYPSVQGIWGQTSWYDFHPEPVLHQDTVPCFFFFLDWSIHVPQATKENVFFLRSRHPFYSHSGTWTATRPSLSMLHKLRKKK